MYKTKTTKDFCHKIQQRSIQIIYSQRGPTLFGTTFVESCDEIRCATYKTIDVALFSISTHADSKHKFIRSLCFVYSTFALSI